MFKKMKDEWKKLYNMLRMIAFFLLMDLVLSFAAVGFSFSLSTHSPGIAWFTAAGSLIITIMGLWYLNRGETQ